MAREFDVWFSNFTECVLGLSDISWSVTVTANTEAEALELAMAQAMILNRDSGMPPHGIRLSEDRLRRLAYVAAQPERRETMEVCVKRIMSKGKNAQPGSAPKEPDRPAQGNALGTEDGCG
jgi:hypothetical protein